MHHTVVSNVEIFWFVQGEISNPATNRSICRCKTVYLEVHMDSKNRRNTTLLKRFKGVEVYFDIITSILTD